MRVLPPRTIPELQLQNEIVAYSREMIEKHAGERRKLRSSAQWDALRDPLIRFIKNSFYPSVLKCCSPLNARLVSREEFAEYRIENVLFESMLGWEVNATVYLPKKEGIYPGVVCPTGHSSKTMASYQTSAQIFARNGYIAVSFDPPGCVGEKAYMNDHFTNGVIGYLTGIWSNSYFVADAIRCIDYLETRQDVDTGPGVTLTGVSGGGSTSIYASLLDDRVKFVAPVCCLSEHEAIHFKDLYTGCPEAFGPGYIGHGIDYVDLIAVQAPKPCLIVGGMLDEVLDYRSTQRLFQDIQSVYRLYQAENELGLFLQQDSGHAYTAAMANEVVLWMNRIIKREDRQPLQIGENDIELQYPDKLKCHPSNDVNMFSINRSEAQRLEISRSYPDSEHMRPHLISKAAEVLGIDADSFCFDSVWEEENPPVRWAHQLQQIDIVKEDMHIPGLLYKRVLSSMTKVPDRRRPAMLFIDEDGKWKGFSQGYLSKAGRFLERKDQENEPMILSIDISGLGELKPQPTAYDMASWNDIERILTYLSISNGKPVMGLRIRDALRALHYLKARGDVDPDRIIIGGRGLGALVALHTALFAEKTDHLILWDMLINYKAMTESFPFSWPQSIIIPNILKNYDLQDLLQAIPCKKTIINPLDAQKNPISHEKASVIYKSGINLFAQTDEGKAKEIFISRVLE